jgi:hypothetical protein
MSKFEEIEKERLNFDGVEMDSHIDGKRIRFFSQAERNRRIQYSNFIISGMVLVVIAFVAVIFYIKFVMVVQSHNRIVNGVGIVAPSLINAIQIQV